MIPMPLSDAERWQAVARRDRRADSAFVYAVRSTGVYCRPSCPSRRPRRDRVEFFPVPAVAEQAGYRACRRCQPRGLAGDVGVALTERACRLLERRDGPRSLAVLSRELGVSPGHLQRVFSRVTGISPRIYGEALRAGRLREALRNGTKVTRAMYEAGYGSPSRIYGDSTSLTGMTPATYGKGGKGMRIEFTTAESPLGRVLVGATEQGVCFVGLETSDRALEQALRQEFPAAEVHRARQGLGGAVRGVLAAVAGRTPDPSLPLDIQGTAFQRQVWEALRRIPRGRTVTYGELARRIRKPAAARAVAGACAANPVAVLVPCHRVIRGDGSHGGYRWGVERKEQLLKGER